MFDVVCVGSATKDVYVRSPAFLESVNKKFVSGKAISLGLGAKVDVDHVFFETGGGATNAAVSFSRMGLNVGCLAKLGDDAAGKHVKEELKNEGVSDKFLITVKRKECSECHTGYATVLSAPSGERSILVYRGVNALLMKKELPFRKLKTKWLYITSLSQKSAFCLVPLLKFAKEKGVKVAWNPGSAHLKLGLTRVRSVLSLVDVLLLNREEASVLSGISYGKEKELLKTLSDACSGIVVMTEGRKGVVVSDGRFVYRCKGLCGKVVDTLGAGDAFGSGFVSALVRGKSASEGIRLGILNATSVIGFVGAKKGLLRKRGVTGFEKKVGKVKVVKEKL